MRFFQYVGILVGAFAVLSPLGTGPFRQDESRSPLTELALKIRDDKIHRRHDEVHRSHGSQFGRESHEFELKVR